MASRAFVPGELFRRCRANNAARGEERTTLPSNLSGESTNEEIRVENNVCEDDEIAVVDDHPVAACASKSNKRKSSNSRSNGEKTAKKAKKWSWSAELVEMLLKYVKEYKTQCEFNGVDFEADQQSMYTEIRKCMAADSDDPTEVGPESLTEQEKDFRDMEKEEYEAFHKKREEEKKSIRKGYERIKEKVKSVRQDCRSAVNKGTRSGSGKIVQSNFELLTDIWGGSPATTSLTFGIDGTPSEKEIVAENGDQDDENSEGTGFPYSAALVTLSSLPLMLFCCCCYYHHHNHYYYQYYDHYYYHHHFLLLFIIIILNIIIRLLFSRMCSSCYSHAITVHKLF